MARISYYVLAAFVLLTLALTYPTRKLETPAAPTVVGGPKNVSGAGHANFMTGPLPAHNTMTWVTTSKGKRFQAHPKSAPHLLAFVNELEAAGAPINSIGGYNLRYIAGSSRWSQHAFGNAIDIDQLGRNRVTAAFAAWSRAHPDVVRNAARKHGIISGGDWKKPDYGHFEWGGTERSGHSRIPASIRFNNPGAQYPADWAKAFGMDGYAVIGGGHLIARFPDPVAGAAANMFLLNKSYVGMTIGAAGTKWTGSNGSGVPGYDPARTLTHEMLNDRSFVIPFMKAIAEREAGRKSPLTDDQWVRAFNAYRAGKFSADSKATSTEIDSMTQSHTRTKVLPNSGALGAFTVRQGRRYHATVKLRGIEQWATNETIAERLRKVGFSEIEVEGSGHTREARARWPKPDSTSSIDEHLINVFELPDA